MKILQNYDLTKLNTFGVKASAKFFVEINSEKDLKEVLDSDEFKNNEKLFLGRGSNILFTKDFDGMVVLNKLKGIEIIQAPTPVGVEVPTASVGKDTVLVRAMGGELWHDLVLFAVNKDYWGIENMALIPGTAGASPIQNIGAYGVELKDVLESVEVFNIENGQKETFSKEECKFNYRESIFKNEAKSKYFISAIILKLSKLPKENTSYKALEEYLKQNNLEIKNSRDVSDAVSAVRRSKLPDPKVLGNAGSFFKNVYVDEKKFEELKKKYPEMPMFQEGDLIKISAGWLIEQCGWKGKKNGNVGVHEKQALVLVNYGGATGEEILSLANQIIDSVYQKFGLQLIPEVNLI